MAPGIVNSAHESVAPNTSQPAIMKASPAPITHLSGLLRKAALLNTGLKICYPFKSDPSSALDLSYRRLLQLAESNKECVRAIAQEKGSRIVLMHFDNHPHNFEMFWSIVLAGNIPAISTPFSTDPEQRKAHIHHLKSLLGDPACFTSERLLKEYPEVGLMSVHTIEELHRQRSCSNEVPEPSTDGIAHEGDGPAVLMLTSGSTGFAKAVPLRFSQIIASVEGKSSSIGSTSDSTFLNWIGLDHVANLMEIHLQALYLGASQIHVHANDLIADPLTFLRLIHQYRISHTFGPNFFLAMLRKDLALAAGGAFDLDLSCLKAIVTGGEANVVETANSLGALLSQFGAQDQVIWPAYGLTEACAALTYGRFDPDYEAAEHHEFATIGRTFPGAEMRVVNSNGQMATPYEVGLIEIGGTVLFTHYYNNKKATQESFTSDGFFMTGDRGYIDKYGFFNLAGRKKEVILINGVKYAPHDIESVLDKANLSGALCSYYAAFAHREESSPTEQFCVVYCSADPGNGASNLKTAEQIAKISSVLVSARPCSVIPLSQDRLEKSSLGKLSRSKLRTQFEKGLFDDVKIRTLHPLDFFAERARKAPVTATELKIVQTLGEMLDLPIDLVSIDQNLFELGITSVSLFRFEKMLRQRFDLTHGISIINFLSNPVIEAIASSIDYENGGAYNPVAQLQLRGEKTPLWLVHPASGNVLAFLPLARCMTDRPLFALTARGLRPNEEVFSSLAEMANTYYEHVRATQPQGPYAIMGYSLGSSVAFEVAKRIEAGGDEVAFCGVLDSPPHIAPLVGPLDWTYAAVLVTFFLDLLPQTDVLTWTEKLRGLPQMDTAEELLAISKTQQRESLNLDPGQLLAIINIAHNFGLAANQYSPEGTVRRVDCFWCTPLHSVERSREKWRNEYLNHWADFSRETPAFYETEGDHADMINATFVHGFKEKLDRVLSARGI